MSVGLINNTLFDTRRLFGAQRLIEKIRYDVISKCQVPTL